MGRKGAQTMGSEATNPKQPLLNPNWAQLQQKVKSRIPKQSGPFIDHSNAKNVATSLGKRKERPIPEPVSHPVSVLTPTNTDCSLTDAIAMDCEMVGVSPEGNKSALGRVTLVNAWGNVLYDEYVRPLERIVDFRSKISGIRPHNLRKAKEFQAVQKKVAEMIRGRILVGHSLRNDLKVLFLSHPKRDTRDTSEYQPFLKEGRKQALRVIAAKFLNVTIQQKEHCPIEDARAAMLIYQKHEKEWERSLKARSRFKEKHKSHQRKRISEQKDAV